MLNFKQEGAFSEYGSANVRAFEKDLQGQTFPARLTQLNVYTSSRIKSHQLVETP